MSIPSPSNRLKDYAEQRRAILRQRGDCVFVDPAEFCRLLVSHRKLVRANEQAADVQGILDLETGQRFLIERERLFRSV